MQARDNEVRKEARKQEREEMWPVKTAICNDVATTSPTPTAFLKVMLAQSYPFRHSIACADSGCPIVSWRQPRRQFASRLFGFQAHNCVRGVAVVRFTTSDRFHPDRWVYDLALSRFGEARWWRNGCGLRSGGPDSRSPRCTKVPSRQRRTRHARPGASSARSTRRFRTESSKHMH